MKKDAIIYIITAVIIGAFSSILSYKGNPINTGICISCFIENYAGGLKLHNNTYMQYLRPEITFIILGSFLSSIIRREFIPKINYSLFYYFIGGFFMIIGSAIFIGCPIKMLLKLAGGDLNSIAGIFGLITGVYIAIYILKEGVDTSLFKTSKINKKVSSLIFIIFIVIIYIAYLIFPFAFAESTAGGGAEKAPLFLSLLLSFIIGIFAQTSRFCITGAVRNSLILKNSLGFIALVALILAAFILNLFLNQFHLGIYGQSGSHIQWHWSFLGMLLTGYIAVIIDGCPFRQLVKSGEGDINAQIAFFGMLVGGAVVQNFNILSDASGPTTAGKIWLLIGFIFFSLITLEMRKNEI
jgi:YedE family putative selenium metabolism protein